MYTITKYNNKKMPSALNAQSSRFSSLIFTLVTWGVLPLKHGAYGALYSVNAYVHIDCAPCVMHNEAWGQQGSLARGRPHALCPIC